MKRLLQILPIRQSNEQVIWDELLAYMSEIPPVYKAFYNCYNIEINLIDPSKTDYIFFLEQFSTELTFALMDTHVKSIETFFDSFFSLSVIVEQINQLKVSDDEIDQTVLGKVIPVGISSTNAYLLLGIDATNKDQIYLQNPGKPNILLAENIFEFCKELKLIPETNRWLPDLNILYRNWGEDFWRIRGEK